MRTILWVGSGSGAGCGVVADAVALDVAWARDVEDALELPVAAFDALVLDLPRVGDARAALSALSESRAEVPTLVRIDPAERNESSVLAASGANRVMLRAAEGSETSALLDELERLPARKGPPKSPERGLEAIIGGSRALETLRKLARQAARSNASILIAGETGTGKELLARAIHEESPRRRATFVALNCAAFPEALLESELFGHVKGAFTGADRERKGLFAAADSGTLFLDEVGETSPGLQAKLLRVLQEGEVRPVGGTRARRVDVRVVAATNRNLEQEIERGSFREDLFYRLAVFPLRMPSLRERIDDVVPLAHHFLGRHARREAAPPCPLAREAEEILQVHAWPGNVRELENEVERALALVAPGQTLRPEHFSERLGAARGALRNVTGPTGTLREALNRVEAWYIRRALAELGGHRTATARKLGVTREGLYKKMKRLGIQ
ncbi:MAG: sigma 54-interacting transcriptional regulator [Deltaproteobacteria bacterium]|nr:sigma 54-interacting transcriptional regulator [Deltaproteobacteria bacterium]MBW2447191.1 sigma 54-interacting transcriptional regulator [Deltaproteobacteria bacterium]